MESGNTRMEPESRASREGLLADARMRFDALRAVGVLTENQARSIVHLLERDEGTLSPRGRAFRGNITRYLKKEAEFVTVFAEMLQLGENPAPSGLKPPPAALARKSPGFWFKTPNRDPSLPLVKLFLVPAVLASGVVILAALAVLPPGKTGVLMEPPPRKVPLGNDAGEGPPVPVTAVFPSTISPLHAGKTPYEAALNTCYDQFKANREINANGGLSWNQNGGGYYTECRKRLKP